MTQKKAKKMTLAKFKRILPAKRKFKCSRCPIPRVTCNAIAKGIWGEEKCLLRKALREVLVFSIESAKKPVV